jgi:hypothetical protein
LLPGSLSEGGVEPCHCKVLNLQGFEFAAIETRLIANRPMANAPIANAPTATAPDRGGDHCHAAEAQRLWITEILPISSFSNRRG